MAVTTSSSRSQAGRSAEGHAPSLRFLGWTVLLCLLLCQHVSALPATEQITIAAQTAHTTTETETTIAVQVAHNTTLQIMTEATLHPLQTAAYPSCEYLEVAQYRLWRAVRADDGPGVERAVRCGADVEELDLYGMTPLTLAAKLCREDALRSLLRLGAHVDRRDGWRRMSPLQWAALYGGDRCVNILLLGGGAWPGSVPRAEAQDLLWRGVEEDDVLKIKEAVLLGADVEEEREDWTPLTMASRYNRLAAVKSLLRFGARLEEKRGPWGRTALHFASWKGHEALVRLLLEAGASVGAEDEDRKTPLYLASWEGHEAVVRVLLEAGASVWAEDRYGGTPLYLASRGGHEAVVRVLLEAGASPKAVDVYGRTPLHKASAGGHLSTVRLLVEAGADINHRDRWGYTPLVLAGRWKNAQVEEYLRSVGAAT